jgi:RNA polymerase sigma-70 factor, ECF subfamily
MKSVLIDLLNEAQNGSRKAFDELFKSHKHIVEKVVKYKARTDKNETDIIVNEIFARVFNKLHTFSFDYEFEPWLTKVAINICNRYISERIKRNSYLILDDTLVEYVRTVDSAEAIYISNENIESFISYIKKFKERDYNILYLRYLEAYSYEDIVKELNVSLHIVKNIIHKNKENIENFVIKK